MQRVAALYDIHGNLPALEAVLSDVSEAGADALLIGGDVVPGPMPGDCLELLAAQDLPARWIRGNGDVDVVSVYDGITPARAPEAVHAVLQWVVDRITSRQRDLMASWPLTLSLPIPPLGEVLFCHATPRDDNEIFTEITPADRLREVFDPTEAAVVVCGHTHMPFERKVGEVRVVNAGSVGFPFGDRAARWALIDGRGVELRRTEYDLERAMARIGAAGYPFPLDLAQPPSRSQMLERFEAVAIGS